jgi:hypothetical protein
MATSSRLVGNWPTKGHTTESLPGDDPMAMTGRGETLGTESDLAELRKVRATALARAEKARQQVAKEEQTIEALDGLEFEHTVGPMRRGSMSIKQRSKFIARFGAKRFLEIPWD